jgi:DNA-binding transcriptional regulator YiaG
MGHKRKAKPENWAVRVEALTTRYGSAEALALAAGVSYLTVQRWRVGIHKPSHLARKRLEELERKQEAKA